MRCICGTCVYGFPASDGWSCGVMRKLTNSVVVRCGQYAPKTERRREMPESAQAQRHGAKGGMTACGNR